MLKFLLLVMLCSLPLFISACQSEEERAKAARGVEIQLQVEECAEDAPGFCWSGIRALCAFEMDAVNALEDKAKTNPEKSSPLLAAAASVRSCLYQKSLKKDEISYLDTPSNEALVSILAAAFIGLNEGGVGRLKMYQEAIEPLDFRTRYAFFKALTAEGVLLDFPRGAEANIGLPDPNPEKRGNTPEVRIARAVWCKSVLPLSSNVLLKTVGLSERFYAEEVLLDLSSVDCGGRSLALMTQIYEVFDQPLKKFEEDFPLTETEYQKFEKEKLSANADESLYQGIHLISGLMDKLERTSEYLPNKSLERVFSALLKANTSCHQRKKLAETFEWTQDLQEPLSESVGIATADWMRATMKQCENKRGASIVLQGLSIYTASSAPLDLVVEQFNAIDVHFRTLFDTKIYNAIEGNIIRKVEADAIRIQSSAEVNGALLRATRTYLTKHPAMIPKVISNTDTSCYHVAFAVEMFEGEGDSADKGNWLIWKKEVRTRCPVMPPGMRYQLFH